MEDIFKDLYKLPSLVRRFDMVTGNKLESTRLPYDELFVWSLLLYSGRETDLRLIKHFWHRTKYPMACALVAMSVYKYFLNKSFIPEDLKESLVALIK